MVEQLAREADWLDFGTGDEYKRHFGDESWDEEDVLVYAPRVRPVWVNLRRSGVTLADRSLRAALERTRLGSRARRAWRGRLREATTPRG